MNASAIGFLMVCCIAAVSCHDDEKRIKSYCAVHDLDDDVPTYKRMSEERISWDEVLESGRPKIRPKLSQMVKQLQELRELFESDDSKSKLIDELLERAEVSNASPTCHRCQAKICDECEGDIYEAKKLLKPKLCKEWWEAFLIKAGAELETGDRETLDSLVQSIIDANGGREATPDVLEVDYQLAQEGVLRYMEKKRGERISRAMRSSKFDKLFDQYIADPCYRVAMKLKGIADEYFQLMTSSHPTDQLDPNTSDLVRKARVCKNIRGMGYSSNSYDSFRKDFHENLKYLRPYFKWNDE